MRPEAELLLVNAKVTTLAADPDVAPEVDALAIRGGRVLFAGASADAREHATANTTVVDVGGRRVVPGLIDSHVHFVRAGLTWNDEVRWEDIADLATGLDRIARAAAQRPPGTWIRVIGGWHPGQCAERRGPTRDELDRAAPGHPVFLQCGYAWGMLNTRAMAEVDLARAVADGENPANVDTDGGVLRGMAALRWLYWRLPVPTLDEQVDSTAAASAEMSRRGLTGLIDGGGSNSGPDVYRAVYEAWRQNRLTVRTRLTVHSSKPGSEPEELPGYLRFLPPGLGDDMLRVLGMGEIVHYGVHDGIERDPRPSDRTLAELDQIFRDCLRENWPLQIHTIRPDTIELVLGRWERLDPDRIRRLRWSLVHGEGLDAGQVRRLRRLGAGVLAPAMLRFEGEDMTAAWTRDRAGFLPPLRELLDAGVPVGGGTDAMRVASYLPFTALHWYVTGRTVSGRRLSDHGNLLTRTEALRLYTERAAWFSFEEATRGRLEPGMLADLVVLDRDYFTVPEPEIPHLGSDLTLVGGRPTWASDAFAGAVPEG
ncbi:amidohydrolase [Pseudonocardia acaciae]|uniref:amidohydrolase n=1 Tax=Pseudonocardia acaciae TaxID=551276 RepID=UPI00048AE2E9|nr:amidohydrolase family protein [Pseudonocardia acaciae]